VKEEKSADLDALLETPSANKKEEGARCRSVTHGTLDTRGTQNMQENDRLGHQEQRHEKLTPETKTSTNTRTTTRALNAIRPTPSAFGTRSAGRCRAPSLFPRPSRGTSLCSSWEIEIWPSARAIDKVGLVGLDAYRFWRYRQAGELGNN